jgi:hypothetical protein
LVAASLGKNTPLQRRFFSFLVHFSRPKLPCLTLVPDLQLPPPPGSYVQNIKTFGTSPSVRA